MKLLTYADRSVLIGDDAADALIHYSALLADSGHADSVVLNALDTDGDEIVASFVLGSGTNLMAATSTSKLPVPSNVDGLNYLKQKIENLTSSHNIQPDPEANSADGAFGALPGDGY
jgi:hypothetical protein